MKLAIRELAIGKYIARAEINSFSWFSGSDILINLGNKDGDIRIPGDDVNYFVMSEYGIELVLNHDYKVDLSVFTGK